MTSLLIEQLKNHAAERPTQIAYAEVERDQLLRQITWSELLGATSQFAMRFAGCDRRPTVIVCTPNCIEYLVVFFGTLMADGVVFPMPTATTSYELDLAIDATAADVVVADRDKAAASAERVRLIAHDEISLESTNVSIDEAIRRHSGRGAMLLQSSGTTGLPKIVRRDLRALEAVGRNCAEAIGISCDDAMLAAVPISHSYAIDHAVMAAALAGCRVDLCAHFLPGPVLQSMGEFGTTIMPVVPFMIDMLNAEMGSRPPMKANQLRRVYSAGGVLPEATANLFHERFGVAVGQVYGSTEVASATFNDPDASGFNVISVGQPMCDVEIRILDPNSRDVTQRLAAGAEGHVAIKAPSMLSSYVNVDESPFFDGFFLSGDLGRLDDDGRLTIIGRIKLLIDVGGQKVNPIEVETLLRQHPSVADVVVLPVTVTPTVQRIKAVVEWRDQPGDLDELRQLARERLSPYKVPRYFESVQSLPRSPAGKVLRQVVAL